MHPCDGRAGQDVMELVEQYGFPELVELIIRVVSPGVRGSGRRPQLGLHQQLLGPTVTLLRLVLTGQRGTVQF